MRGFANRFGLGLSLTLFLAAAASAQTESIDPPDPATPVVVTQQPPTYLDSIDQARGLTVRGLTLVGSINDDRGGTLEVYVVTIRSDDPQLPPAKGLAIVVRPKDGPAARAYVDDGEIDRFINGVKQLAAMDKAATPMQESRGVYRTGNIAVLNVDDNGGRTAIVRTLTVSPITSQATFAAARFRANRLNDLLRHLQAAKETLAKLR